MESAFAATAIMNFTAIVLKSIVHVGMTEFIPANHPGASFAITAGDEIISWLNNSMIDKIKKTFSRRISMQEKLNDIVQTSFDSVNEKFECQFSGIPSTIVKENPDIDKKEDFLKYVWRWSLKKNEDTISRINSDTVRQFVNEFYQEVNDRINQDDDLNMHLATLHTKEGVKAILAEISELKKVQSSCPDVRKIEPEIIKMTEDNLKQQLEFLKATNGNIIDNSGEGTAFSEIHQKNGNGSNVIRNIADHSTFKEIIQE